MEKVSGSSPLTSTKITQSNDCVIFLSVNVLCANKFARATALNRYALTLHFASKLARSAIKRVRSKGQEPNHRLAFGGCLRFLALCAVFVFADTLCRLVVNLRNRGPQKILLYFWGKGAHKHKSEHCRPDNAISKVQLPGTPRDTVYPRGKGAHKQKSEHYLPR